MQRRFLLLALVLITLLSACGSVPHTTGALHKPLPPGALSGHQPTAKLVAQRYRAQLSASAPIEVPSKPKGPTGSYTPVFADGFGSLSAWKLQQTPSGRRGCCNNSNEIGDMVPAKAVQVPGLLELRCAHETSPLGRPYSCSGADSNFNWQPGHGQTMIFEVEAQWPSNAGEGQDPGWWSTDNPWTDEIDFFEAWGWGHLEYYAGMPCWLPKAGGGSDYCHEIYKPKSEIPNPETAFHTYTSVVKPNNEIEEWIDGVHRWNLGPISGINTPWMHLILTHAMRGSSTSGTSVFSIKRVEVFEDSSHAGVGAEHGGVASGTCISGTTSCGSEPKPEPEPTPTTTETTPTPPPAITPPTPTGCKATPHDEGTTAWVSISCEASAGASKYVLYRLPIEAGASEAKAWTTSTTPTFANHKEVVQGHRYAYWIAAENASGRSGFASVAVFKA